MKEGRNCQQGITADASQESNPVAVNEITGRDADGALFTFDKSEAQRYLLHEDENTLVYRGDIFYGFDGKYTTMFCSDGTQAITIDKSTLFVKEHQIG